MLHFGWKEVYFGYDMKKFNQIRNLLEGKKMKVKARSTNPTRDRFTTVGGGRENFHVFNSTGTNQSLIEYTLWVKKEREEEAFAYIQELVRNSE